MLTKRQKLLIDKLRDTNSKPKEDYPGCGYYTVRSQNTDQIRAEHIRNVHNTPFDGVKFNNMCDYFY